MVQCMAWKGDMMVLADNEGNLSIWQLKARVTRYIIYKSLPSICLTMQNSEAVDDPGRSEVSSVNQYYQRV